MSCPKPSPTSSLRLLPLAILVFAALGFGCGPSYPQVQTSKDFYAQVDDMAKKCGGDFTKLSEKDQKNLDVASRGHGKVLIANRYKELLAKGAH